MNFVEQMNTMFRQISRQISFPSNKEAKEESVDKNGKKEKQNDRFAQNFMTNIKLFFEEAKDGSVDFLSDFTLKSGIDGIEHKAHKIILASQSKYFRGLFRNDPTASSVTLDFENSILSACLEGIYTGTTPLSFDNVQDTLIAADYLGVDELVKQATKFIILNMDDTNCYDILIFGYDQGHDEMADNAASYIGSGLYDQADSNSEELYALPPKIFSKILQSNGLTIKDKISGIISIGLSRELKILSLIEKYISIHPEHEIEEFLSGCRFDGFDFRGVGKYHLVKQTLLIVLDTNLDREEKVIAVNRAIQMSHEMDDTPINDVLLKEFGSVIVAQCEAMSEKMKGKIITYSQATQSLKGALSLKQRKLL